MSGDVYFETITAAHRPLVQYYLRRGERLFVYDFTYRLKAIPWLAPLINDGRIERIYVHPLSRADHDAIRAADWLYPRLSHHPLVRRLETLFGRDEAATVLKRGLLYALFPYVFMRLDLAQRCDGARRTVLVPSTYLSWQRALQEWPEAPAPLEGVRIPRVAALWSAWATRAEHWRDAERTVASAVRTALRARRSAARGGMRAPARAFDYVYAVEQPFQTKFDGARRVDFLIDGERLTRKNTAFLVSPGADGPWADQATREGFEIVRRKDYAGLGHATDTPGWRDGWGRLALATALSPAAPNWIRSAAAAAAYVALGDVPLLERVAFRHYVYTNQDTVLQGWRNALLRRRGVQSWCFTLAIGGGYLYTDGPEADHRYWAYQNADHFVTASRQLVEYQRRHRQRITHYHNVGNIWSELVREVDRRVGRSTLRRTWFGEGGIDKPVVAWFDTSFVQSETSPSTYDEAIAWYEDLERFLRDFPDVRVVIKPSKDDAYFVDMRTQWADVRGPALMEIWRRLRAHPRVYFPGHTGDPPSIIAASDLVITYCFSSISAEALGAGVRAIWYEPGERWRQTLYGRVPGLVAHGYAELRRCVEPVLQDAAGPPLDGIRGVVEDFLDGRGLTRFRELLAMPSTHD